jgi:tetratricopeptide (TPR) repeat protein
MKGIFWILSCLLAGLINSPLIAQETSVGNFEKGKIAWQQHDFKRSLEFFNEAIRLQPDFLEAYPYRASSLVQLDKPEAAVTDYVYYLHFRPNDSEVLLSLSILNYQLKRYALAREGFLRLQKLPPGETQMVYFRQPLYSQGVTSLFTAQSHDRSFLYNYLGLSEQGMNNTAAALAYLDTAIQMNPENPDYYVNRGLIYQETSREAQAEADYLMALELNPQHDLARYNMAVLKENTNDPAKAEAYYTQSIQDNPSSPYAYRQRGYRRMMAGEYNQALADFNEVLSLDPNDVETLINRGILYEKKQLYDIAIDDYSNAIRLKPGLAKAYFNRGNSLYKQGNYKDALNDYEVALIHDREYDLAYYQRAITLYRLGEYVRACQDIREAVKRGVGPASATEPKICGKIDP